MSMTEELHTDDSRITDILIIGGGPTGLFTAFYCGMRDATCKIIDSLPELGGQLTALYPEKFIYDVAGFPKIKARDLVQQLTDQALQFQASVHLEEEVVGLNRRDDGLFELSTNKATHLGRAVIVCAGIGAFTPRPLPDPMASRFDGRGVSYYVDRLEHFQGKRVLVVGGGDTALDYALMLDGVAASVTLIHRRDEFRAHEDSVRQLQASGVHVRTFHELVTCHGDDCLTKVTLVQNQTKETIELDVDVIVSGLGFSASLGPIQNFGIEIVKNEIVVNTRMETNVPGIYAAGDVVTYPGKVKLIATGFGEAPTAVNNAKTFIDPKARLSPGHSSSRKE